MNSKINWKIIFQLSIFGLIMAFATISLIPEKIEFVFWLVIFLFCAWVIAKVCNGKYFFQGNLCRPSSANGFYGCKYAIVTFSASAIDHGNHGPNIRGDVRYYPWPVFVSRLQNCKEKIGKRATNGGQQIN
jgi:hypothetical protein